MTTSIANLFLLWIKDISIVISLGVTLWLESLSISILALLGS